MPTNPVPEMTPEGLLEKEIFELLGLQSVPEDKRQEMVAVMVETIENRVLARVLDSLTEEDQSKFDELLDGGDDRAHRFLMGKGIDLTRLALEEVMFYKATLVSTVTGATMQPA